MIDGIIKADGTSRLMQAELPATYEEFRARCATGTQPLDVLFNALGWSQMPTFLNKANLLRDPTAALFGLGNEAVPNTIFDWIGQYNTYWWSVLHGQASFKYVEKKTLYDYSSVNISGFFINEYGGGERTIQYSETVNVNEATGEVALSNPISVSFASRDPNLDFAASLTAILPGKYVLNADTNENLVYISPSATISRYLYGGLQYFALAVSDGDVYEVGSQIVNIPAGETTYVHSTDRNAYPDSGTVDGLTYEYLGIPFQNAVTAPRIATGSYTGTGTYGASNPNSLTFDFKPKLLLVQNYTKSIFNGPEARPSDWMLAINGITNIMSAVTGNTNDTVRVLFTWSGNTVSWYEATVARYQLNTSGEVYGYIAIG